MKGFKSFFLFTVFLMLYGHCDSTLPERKTICLNMIVKDESEVILRCLASVKSLIDYWVIVDTGSTDGTQEIIKEFLKDIPGELYEKPWKNFAHNRNEALDLAKGKSDYIIFADADEEFLLKEDFHIPSLEKDFYEIIIEDTNLSIPHIQLVKSSLNWKWIGVLHEGIMCSEARSFDLIEGVVISQKSKDGCRAKDPQKNLKDIQVLEEALKEDPNNSRYVFYLAQTYLNAEEYHKALKQYERRISLGGKNDEVFHSLYLAGLIKEFYGHPFEESLKNYTDAYFCNPERSETLYQMGLAYFRQKNYILAYSILKLAASISIPDSASFVKRFVYEYGAALEAANCGVLLGKKEESLKEYKRLLNLDLVPLDIKEIIRNTIIELKLEFFEEG
jgi:glycosyltransferase involved in cell wall biosynthesis